jgi:hypothetical protein
MAPAWRDPRYLTDQRVAQFEAHEEQIRLRERERERRRLLALLVIENPVEDEEFPGCVW